MQALHQSPGGCCDGVVQALNPDRNPGFAQLDDIQPTAKRLMRAVATSEGSAGTLDSGAVALPDPIPPLLPRSQLFASIRPDFCERAARPYSLSPGPSHPRNPNPPQMDLNSMLVQLRPVSAMQNGPLRPALPLPPAPQASAQPNPSQPKPARTRTPARAAACAPRQSVLQLPSPSG